MKAIYWSAQLRSMRSWNTPHDPATARAIAFCAPCDRAYFSDFDERHYLLKIFLLVVKFTIYEWFMKFAKLKPLFIHFFVDNILLPHTKGQTSYPNLGNNIVKLLVFYSAIWLVSQNSFHQQPDSSTRDLRSLDFIKIVWSVMISHFTIYLL